VVSLGLDVDGKRIRKKLSGRTKTEVREKLKDLHDDLDEGVKSSPTYSVQLAITDWLEQGLDGRSVKTVSTNREVLAPLAAIIGKIPLRDLTAAHRPVGADQARRHPLYPNLGYHACRAGPGDQACSG
jgi:hypothetical protein